MEYVFHFVITVITTYIGVSYLLKDNNEEMIILSSDDLVLTPKNSIEESDTSISDSVLNHLYKSGYDVLTMTDTEICDVYKKSFHHITSHRVEDVPCICFFVYSDLRNAGYDTTSMSIEEVCSAYQKLYSKNPTRYRKLYVN